MSDRPALWWETRRFALAAILLSMVPLLVPPIPPLVDLPGHIGRYHVALAIAHSPVLQQHWIYHWKAVGNLGVDLLVMPLAPLTGVELAAKLVVMAIPPLFVGGLLWLSHETDGRISPAVPMAFPLVYGFPFQFGFVNFMLAAALAIVALAWWVRLGRQGRIALRTVAFVPISCALWLAHNFGWGMFGLFAFPAELIRLRRAGASWPRAIVTAGLLCAALALPMVAMVSGGSSGSGHGLGAEYTWLSKLFWIATVLRENWKIYDVICTCLLIAMLFTAVRRPKVFGFEPVTGTMALIGLASFVALPRLLLGGAYVDMRMLGIAMALGLAAIRLKPAAASHGPGIAIAASAFFVMRTVTTTISLLGFAHVQAKALEVVPAIPRGAAVLVIVKEPCGTDWRSDRLEHIDGIAIARRDIFDNGQWALAGQQLIAPRHPGAEPYRADPSQLAYPTACEYRTTIFAKAIREFDRRTFQYVWTMGFPAGQALAPDTRLVWHNGLSTLYRVEPRLSPGANAH